MELSTTGVEPVNDVCKSRKMLETTTRKLKIRRARGRAHCRIVEMVMVRSLFAVTLFLLLSYDLKASSVVYEL